MAPCLRTFFLGLLIVMGSSLAPASARAADLSAMQRSISISVREQPVQQFLETLFAQIDVPVVVSGDVEGLMNGRFEGTAQEVFEEVAQAFNVRLYHDGVVAHIYSANDITQTLMPLNRDDARRVQQLASRMQLGDTANHVDSSAGGGLLVTGTQRYLQQIEELSMSVQSHARTTENGPMAYRVFHLSNAWADDTRFEIGGQEVLVKGVATLLQELLADGVLPAALSDRRRGTRDHTLEGLRGRGLQSVSRDEAAAIETAQAELVEYSTASSGARIVADSRLNAVIIRDTADRMAAYQALIEDLDQPSQMVEIEATIIDINTDKTRELGIGWQYTRGDGELSLIGGTGEQSGEVFPNTAVQGPGAILSMMLGGREQFLARIRALEEKGAARVVSRPHVVTLSDVEAVLGATTEFFVRVAGAEEVDLFNVPVGTTLRVTPHVIRDAGLARIKLLVNIEDGAASAQQVDSIPVVERATINTQAVINEGDSLLIGGLVRDSYRQVASSVPLLGGIPVLGRLFKSTGNSASRVERLFMITPRTAQGTGFGTAFSADRELPVLQGKPEIIESMSANRTPDVSQPFGSTVNDIPFKPLERPRQHDAADVARLQRDSGEGNPASGVADPEQGQWLAVPSPRSSASPEDSGSRPVDPRWNTLPVTLPTAVSVGVPQSDADDGWVDIP